MGIAAIVVVALSCAFYLFVLIQFTRERRRSKRKYDSVTFVGSSEERTVPLPLKRNERFSGARNSPDKQKLVPISQRPVIKSVAPASQTTRNSDRLPYVEIMLPITAIVTRVTTAGEEPHGKLLRRRRASQDASGTC
jgi:hypothetical protein